MRKIKKIEFDKDLSIKYKDEIKEINNIFEELENDKSMQRLYKKYKKRKIKNENNRFNK